MKSHDKLKSWRERRKLTLEQLSESTGYSVIAIRKFEAGARHQRNGEKHKEWVLQRYRMACAGVDAEIRSGRAFEW